MHRIILQTPSFTLYSYGLLMATGFGAGCFYFLYATKKNNISENLMANLCGGIILFSLLGARVFYILVHANYYFSHPLESLRVWEGGMVFYGGLFFSLAFSLLYIKIYRLSLLVIADCAAPAISIGLAIGRIGCFLNGCCYGIPSNFGFVFPPESPAGQAFPNQILFPTQLLSSLNLFIIGFFLDWLRRNKKMQEKLLPFFLIFYSLHRFLVEFLRGDTDILFAGLTLFQLVSIFLAGGSFFFLIFLKRPS